MSLPYYRNFGWDPVVLCVAAASQDGVREPELEQTVPPDIEVVHCPAQPLPWKRRVGVRNVGCAAGCIFFSPARDSSGRSGSISCIFPTCSL